MPQFEHNFATELPQNCHNWMPQFEHNFATELPQLERPACREEDGLGLIVSVNFRHSVKIGLSVADRPEEDEEDRWSE
jgi:hypothetical protein